MTTPANILKAEEMASRYLADGNEAAERGRLVGDQRMAADIDLGAIAVLADSRAALNSLRW